MKVQVLGSHDRSLFVEVSKRPCPVIFDVFRTVSRNLPSLRVKGEIEVRRSGKVEIPTVAVLIRARQAIIAVVEVNAMEDIVVICARPSRVFVLVPDREVHLMTMESHEKSRRLCDDSFDCMSDGGNR